MPGARELVHAGCCPWAAGRGGGDARVAGEARSGGNSPNLCKIWFFTLEWSTPLNPSVRTDCGQHLGANSYLVVFTSVAILSSNPNLFPSRWQDFPVFTLRLLQERIGLWVLNCQGHPDQVPPIFPRCSPFSWLVDRHSQRDPRVLSPSSWGPGSELAYLFYRHFPSSPFSS